MKTWKHLLIEISSISLIILFVYTASNKLIHLTSTYREMNDQLFPNWMTPFLVWGISGAELALASLLIFDRTKKAGLWGSLILMTLFTGYITAILLKLFNKVPCSCGGVLKQLKWNDHLYFNLFFVILSIVSLILLGKKQTKEEYNEAHKVLFY